MAATLERLADSRVVLDVTVPVGEVEEALDGAYRRLLGRVTVPGFRRGKAPRGVFERFVGRPRLWQEALEPLVQGAYEQAAREAGIQPVAPPDMEVTEAEDGQPLRFKATVAVKPEVVLGDYRSIALLPEPAAVQDADVERTIEELRASRAVWAPVGDDEAAETGMLTVIDVTGEIDGRPSDPELGVGAVLGEGQLRPELEAAVLGLRVGETRDLALAFTPDDADTKLAGRAGTFHVALRECKRRQQPELDDEFAREVSDVATLQELRPWLKNRLREAADARADTALGERAAAAAAEQTTIELPPVMVDRQVEANLRDLAREAERFGASLSAYVIAQGKTLDELRADLRPAAERQVRSALVLEAIADREGLTASDEEVRQRVERVVVTYGQQAEAVRRTLARPESQADLRGQLRLEKAVSFLKELARANGVAGLGRPVEAPAVPTGAVGADGAEAPRRGRRRGADEPGPVADEQGEA